MAKRKKKQEDTIESLEAELLKIEQEELVHMEREEKFINSHMWEYFKPFKWQEDCLIMINKKLITLAPAPNKIGKCICIGTRVKTPKGDIDIGDLYKAGKPFDAYAWDGEKEVVAKAHAPFKKEGKHQCYRITMSDGSIIEAADNHRVLTDSGWCFVSELYRSFRAPLDSTLAHVLSTQPLGAFRYLGKQRDCLDDYYRGRHRHDELLPLDLSIAQSFSQPPVDVPIHTCSSSHKGVRGNRYKHTPLRFSALLSNSYGLLRRVGQFVESLSRIFCIGGLLPHVLRPVSPPLSSVAVFRSQPFGEPVIQALGSQGQIDPSRSSSDSPKKINPIYPATNKIISILPIGIKDVYDFTVEKYHNYIAEGLIHHNSALLACVLMSWLRGYEAWNKVDADYPGAVKVDGIYYKPSSLGIKPPVRLRVSGEDWQVHLGETVVPELKKWFPMDDFYVKNHTTGTACRFEDKVSKSVLTLLTHGMEDKLWESWLGDGWAPDEPPPHGKYKAMQRGLFGKRGKTFIPATPLTQAWMLDELVLKQRSDVGVMKDLCCLDNEIYYEHDDKILTEMGLSGKATKHWREMEGQKKTFFDLIMRWELYVPDEEDDAAGKEINRDPDDQGASAEKFLKTICPPEMFDRINDLKFLKFAKDTSLDEKASRFFGMFKKLVGLVFKEYKWDKHVLPAGDGLFPTNWPVTFQIDFHLSKPHAIAFYACSERNIHYCVHEVWENMDAESIASLIIRKKKTEGWRIEEGEIDPLSKGDDKYIKNRDADAKDSFTIISDLLEDEGIDLNVASKDKKSGISNIKAWFKGPNKIPVFYLMDNIQSVKDIQESKYGLAYELPRLCYVDGEIEKKDDHFIECLYRYTLMNVEYSEPVEETACLPGSKGGGWQSS